MNTSTIFVLQIDPELLSEAKSLLRDGETLPVFFEQSITQGIRLRKMRQEFVARGLAAGENAERTGEYVDADEVLRELDAMLLSKQRDDER